MAEFKHTPAPWIVTGTVIDGFVVREECSKVIVAEPNKYLIQSEANAHLIASAPELYEALENLLDAISKATMFKVADAVSIANEVLAKVRGEHIDDKEMAVLI